MAPTAKVKMMAARWTALCGRATGGCSCCACCRGRGEWPSKCCVCTRRSTTPRPFTQVCRPSRAIALKLTSFVRRRIHDDRRCRCGDRFHWRGEQERVGPDLRRAPRYSLLASCGLLTLESTISGIGLRAVSAAAHCFAHFHSRFAGGMQGPFELLANVSIFLSDKSQLDPLRSSLGPVPASAATQTQKKAADERGASLIASLPALAERYYRHAVALSEAAFGTRHPLVSGALCNLADFLADRAVEAAREHLCGSAYAAGTAAAPAEGKQAAAAASAKSDSEVLGARARTLFGEATACYARCAGLRADVAGSDHPCVETVTRRLARLERMERACLALRD